MLYKNVKYLWIKISEKVDEMGKKWFEKVNEKSYKNKKLV